MAVTRKQLMQMGVMELATLGRSLPVGNATRARIQEEMNRRGRDQDKRAKLGSQVSDAHTVRKLLAGLGVRPAESTCYVHHGNPRSKKRHRFGMGRVYKDKDEASAEMALKEELGIRFKVREGALAVGCIFYRDSRRVVDVDNLTKFVLDAANGICWHDDSQVTGIVAEIRYDQGDPRTVFAVGPHRTSMVRYGSGWPDKKKGK